MAETKTTTIIERLSKIQKELKAPKNQFNKFGGFSYRSCEDILEAVKPLLEKDEVVLLSDEIVLVGTRFYVKATATFQKAENSISTSALARESEVKKGMDESQITGASSSYARKYALNGLFMIDDQKDADTRDNREIVKEENKKTEKKWLEIEKELGQECKHEETEEKIAGEKSSRPGAKFLVCKKCGKFVRWVK